MAIFLEPNAQGPGSGRMVPTGGIIFVPQAGAPTGYLVADGSLVPTVTYPNLFAVIGYTFGGAGANFALPDLRGLVLCGAGLGTAVPGLTNHVLNTFGGAETHTLTTGELAAHTHLQNAHTHVQDSHNHLQDSHNHTQDSHNHTQDSHNHTQDSHNHTQNAHTHTQNSHTHTNPLVPGGFNNQDNPASGDGSAANRTATSAATTATNQNTTATNQAATATNQATTATNQAATATNQAATATNQATTATNQNTTAVNQNEGSSTPFSIESPRIYLTPCIAF